MHNEMEAFSAIGVKNSTSLVMLNLGSNPIGLKGITYFIEQGLKFNKSLRFLDLFDIDVTDKSIPGFVDALESNTSLVSLRMANTHVTIPFVKMFWDYIKNHPTIASLKWLNIDARY